jgi:arabinofuranosyltransferase
VTIPKRKLEIFFIAIIGLGFIVWVSAFIYRSSFIAVNGKRYFCLFDDAMVSMRYAWNFSHGRGLVYNTGEYIQGYTNFLMVLLMSFMTLIFDKSTANLFTQISGAGFMLLIAYLSVKISDHFIQNESYDHRVFVRVLSFLSALSYYPLIYWSVMGMETGLLTTLLLLGILSGLNYTENKKPKLLLLVAVYLSLAYLTRNDSIIFAILIWIYIAKEIIESKTRIKIFSVLFPAVSLYILVIIGQAFFQYKYYGELLPNTYTLKLTGMPFFFRIRDGIGFVTPFLFEIGSILILTTIDLIINFRRQKFLLFSMVIVSTSYQIYVGGDPWNYWRIMSPSIPLLLLLFINTIITFVNALLDILNFTDQTRRFTDKTLIILFIFLGLVSINARFWQEILLRDIFQVAENQYNVNTAIVINQLTSEEATLSVFWAGSLPYFTDRITFDMLGKTDRYISHLNPDLSGSVSWDGMKSVPGHNKYDLNYSIIALQPTYVQGFQRGNQDLTKWAQTRYVSVECKGITVSLLKNSPAVNWSKIENSLIKNCY